MASSLSSYWVKFFTAAGFPLDVATKHAVVFSNNRIKPDMLPELDKPSLKEMGIVLMGDMIAILRYAKKVSEEMTCERFLVDSVEPTSVNNTDNKLSKINPTKSTVVKKLPSKVTNVSKITDNNKTKSQIVAKNNLKVKPNIIVTGLKKKTVGSTRIVAPIKKPDDLLPKKRKLSEIETIEDSDTDDSDEVSLKINKRLKSDDSKINYKVIMKRPTNVTAKESSNIKKKLIDQKRTVFDRLGDSSVTSTTNLIDNNLNTTFNITGIGNDVVKRNSGVFKRLGDKDKKDVSAGILKNEINGNKLNQPQGILKNKPNNIGTTVSLIKGAGKSGTMHADHESQKKIVSSSIKQLVRTTKAMKLNSVTSITRKIPNNKLASERLSQLPAKARLGMGMKQVTFNKVATVAHIKKPDVFSRLGV